MVLPNTNFFRVSLFLSIFFQSSELTQISWPRIFSPSLFLQEGSLTAGGRQAWLVPGVPVGASWEMRQLHLLAWKIMWEFWLLKQVSSSLLDLILSRHEKQNEEAESGHFEGDVFRVMHHFTDVENELGTDMFLFLYGRNSNAILFLFFSHFKSWGLSWTTILKFSFGVLMH